MKTKLTLTIIGIIMILQSIIYPLLADMSVDMMFNVGEEAKKVLILFQYAISSIFFMVGLILLIFTRCGEEICEKNSIGLSDRLHTWLYWLLPSGNFSTHKCRYRRFYP